MGRLTVQLSSPTVFSHPAMAVERPMKCSAGFEEDQQNNFTPLLVINSQGNSEQTQRSLLWKTF